MPTDVEERIATYFAWVEERTGFQLRPIDTAELDRTSTSPVDGSLPPQIEVVDDEARGRNGLRMILVGVLVAAAVIGAIVIAKRPDEHPLPPSGTTVTVVPAPVDRHALDRYLERIRLRLEALRAAQAATAAAEAAQQRARDEAARTTIAESIDQQVVGPQGAFTLHLPTSIDERGTGIVQAGRVFSSTYVDAANHLMLTVSVERGVLAADAVTPTDPTTRTIDGLRPEGAVFAWTDPKANNTSMWWAADSTTVVWVYGYGITDEQLRSIVTTIEVGTP